MTIVKSHKDRLNNIRQKAFDLRNKISVLKLDDLDSGLHKSYGVEVTNLLSEFERIIKEQKR